MKTFYKFLPVLIIPTSFLFFAYHTGSPGGYTGSNGDGKDCTQCHGPGPTNIVDGWIITDVPSEGYIPGETYTITTTGTHPGVVRFGFELTAENTSNQKTGTLVITEPARTQLTNATNAVTHTSGGITPTGDSNTWTMEWVAPSAGEGDITFTAAFNAANGNGNNTGDIIYKSVTTIQEMIPQPAIVSVDPDHGEQGWQGTVTITGENTTWLSGVFNVFFINHDDSMEELTVSNIDVKSDTELTADVTIDPDQLIGLYDVQVNNATLENAFTVDIASAVNEVFAGGTVSLYPNPAANFLNVELPTASNITIYDLAGRQVLEKENTSAKEKLDVSSLDNGLYLVFIENKGEQTTMKFLKN